MKKLLTLMLLLVVSFMGYSQCSETPDSAIVVNWESLTHNFYTGAPNYPYAFFGQINMVPGWESEIGLLKNDYRIVAPSGNVPFTYQWKLGYGTATDGVAGQSEIYLWRSSTGAASAVTTNLGVLSTTGTAPSTSLAFLNDAAPGVSRTLTIPANPYYDRDLIFVIKSPGFNVYRTGCPMYVGQVQSGWATWYVRGVYPNGNSGTNGLWMYHPWVEIKIPAKEKTQFVNAGTGVALAIGSPYGTGTTLPVPYPTTVTLGNLLLMVATTRIGTITPVGPPAGWSTFLTTGAVFVFYKIAAGTETGSSQLVYNASTTNGRLARIYQFKHAAPVAHAYNNASHTNTATVGTMANTTEGDLAVSLIVSMVNTTIGIYAGSTVTYSEPVADFAAGNGTTMGINVAPFTSAPMTSGVGTQPLQNNRTLNFVLKQ